MIPTWLNKYPEIKLSPCQFVHHISHMENSFQLYFPKLGISKIGLFVFKLLYASVLATWLKYHAYEIKSAWSLKAEILDNIAFTRWRQLNVSGMDFDKNDAIHV